MIDGEEYLSLPKEKHYAYLPAPINDIAELHEVLDWLKSQTLSTMSLVLPSPRHLNMRWQNIWVVIAMV